MYRHYFDISKQIPQVKQLELSAYETSLQTSF